MELSVVVPCHNVAATLAAQLDALKEQRWEGDWEVVVVDNRSSDTTKDVAEEFAMSSRGLIRTIGAHSGRGVAYARNVGVRASRGSGIAICDGDDIVEPGWVRAMGDALQSYPLVTGSEDVEALNRPAIAKSRGSGRRAHAPRFGTVPFASGGNCAMRREVFERLGGYDESFAGLEDIEFSMRAAAAGISVQFVPEARIQYRYRDDVASLWRQGRFYGASVPVLAKRARQLGLPPPSRVSGLKSWAWLVVNAPKLASADGRLAWLWVLANRVGAFEGSIRARNLYV
jgi:glycosyltransferase involved in cell wall biosynthesis